MRVLVCGGRDYAHFPGHKAKPEELVKFTQEKQHVYTTLYNICDEFSLWQEPDKYGNTMPKNIVIISGAARGVDQTASDWAIVNWVGLEEYPADWDTHKKAAGPIRNQQMLDEGKPDLVVAFPGGRGTADMVRRAKKAGVEVRVVE